MKAKVLIIILVLIIFPVLSLYLPVFTNLWFLLTDKVYTIPKESSIFSFKPIKMNPGSGDWWIYGEDNRNYYYFTGDDNRKYILFPKSNITNCPGFNPTNIRTW